jgi:excisionase family DNA binding protein
MMNNPTASKAAAATAAVTSPVLATSGKTALPRLLTVDTVAERLGTSSKTVRRWITSGALHIHRLGTAARVIRISEEDLSVFIKMGRQ